MKQPQFLCLVSIKFLKHFKYFFCKMFAIYLHRMHNYAYHSFVFFCADIAFIMKI